MYNGKNLNTNIDEYGHGQGEEDGCHYPSVRCVKLELPDGTILEAYKPEKIEVVPRKGWMQEPYGE